MIYIFEEIDRLTSSYFSGGGLVISAKDIDQAKQLIAGHHSHMIITDNDWENVIVYETKWDDTPKMFIFPDAGNC